MCDMGHTCPSPVCGDPTPVGGVVTAEGAGVGGVIGRVIENIIIPYLENLSILIAYVALLGGYSSWSRGYSAGLLVCEPTHFPYANP